MVAINIAETNCLFCTTSPVPIEQSPQTHLQHSLPNGIISSLLHAKSGRCQILNWPSSLLIGQQNSYSNIFWILAEDSTDIEIAYQKLAQDLKIYSEQAPNAIVNLIKVWFHQHPDCLLVYDNAPDYESIQDYFPSRLMFWSRPLILKNALER